MIDTIKKHKLIVTILGICYVGLAYLMINILAMRNLQIIEKDNVLVISIEKR
jgi:hypothetical protein